jgi:hypothetical protein
MSIFDEILEESEEGLLQRFYRFKTLQPQTDRLTEIASSFKLRKEQLLCAYGFNPASRFLIEILPILGYATANELAQERNTVFTSDIYKRLSL